MVRRIKEKGKASRWVVMGPDTGMFAEEPPTTKGKRSNFS